MAARIRKGDLVQVISGSDRGKTGTVKRVLADEGKVVVSGIALVKRHTRGTPGGGPGQIVEREAAIHACKVMPIDAKTGKPTRVRTAEVNGKRVRIATKSGEEIVVAATAVES